VGRRKREREEGYEGESKGRRWKGGDLRKDGRKVKRFIEWKGRGNG
jgi:hypothetical protein